MSKQNQETPQEETLEQKVARLESILGNLSASQPAKAVEQKHITVNQYRVVSDGFGDAKKVDEQVQIYSQDEYLRMTSTHPQDDNGRTVAEVLGLVLEVVEE